MAEDPKDARLEPVIVVSGLPRSGTSMMMRMLMHGGLELLTDEVRAADENNPLGYYEYEATKRLKERDHAWLELARGKVIKVVSPLLEHLPGGYRYRVIFMVRNIDEILDSQSRMLLRNGRPSGDSGNDALARAYSRHLEKVESWISDEPSVDVLYIRYRDVIDDPAGSAFRLEQFLGRPLDREAMMGAVAPSLYRERRDGF